MEEQEKKFNPNRTYKKVFRDPLMFGLPRYMAFIFGGWVLLCFLPTFFFWELGLALLCVNIFGFFQLRSLVEKYSVHFFKKLFSHYMTNDFVFVRNNRRIIKILNKSGE